jgi:hypothetical protein
MFIILTWLNFPDVSFVLNEDASARLFKTYAEAESFAESQLPFNWKIVEL